MNPMSADSANDTPQRPREMPQLPFELLDRILEEGLMTIDPPSISSLALACRGFRIYANEARFSSLTPYKGHVGHDCDGTIRRLDALSKVMREGQSVPTIPGVGEFVTSFQLKVTGYATALQRVLASKSIPFIFTNIFRPTRLYIPMHKPRKLSLSLHPFEWGYSSDVRSHWTMLDTDLQGEFANLLRFSDLNELHLRQIRDVPSSFLQGSKIKHLSFRGVSIQSSLVDEPEPIFLESLAIDHHVPFQDLVHLCSNSSFPHPQAFSYLTTASIQVNYAEDVDTLNAILANGKVIESLIIILHYVGSNDAFAHWGAITYHQHRNLKEISISSSIFTPLSLTIQLLGNDIPQSLKQVEISRAHSYDRHARTAEQVLGSHSMMQLSTHLAQESFDNLKLIVIAFEMDVATRYLAEFSASDFAEHYREYLVSQTQLSKRSSILQVRVGVNEEL